MGCHGQSHLMMEAHPLAAAEDLESRPEHLPLFNSVGARDRDGHMSCTTCHEPHGVLGDDPMLRPSMGDDPDLCTECHRNQRAVAGTHHDMRTTAGEGATVCSACHTAHPREELPLLWAGTLGEGSDFVSRTCTGCHRATGPGRIVPPGTAVHPPNAVMFWADDDTSEGVITCGTCHDVHHWSEDPGETDLQSEGNLFSSFLRRGVAADACAQCHGREAMVRHLLFHQGQRWGHSALIPQEASQ
jgi:predicted CXXCH cytochrome family protein